MAQCRPRALGLKQSPSRGPRRRPRQAQGPARAPATSRPAAYSQRTELRAADGPFPPGGHWDGAKLPTAPGGAGRGGAVTGRPRSHPATSQPLRLREPTRCRSAGSAPPADVSACLRRRSHDNRCGPSSGTGPLPNLDSGPRPRPRAAYAGAPSCCNAAPVEAVRARAGPRAFRLRPGTRSGDRAPDSSCPCGKREAAALRRERNARPRSPQGPREGSEPIWSSRLKKRFVPQNRSHRWSKTRGGRDRQGGSRGALQGEKRE